MAHMQQAKQAGKPFAGQLLVWPTPLAWNQYESPAWVGALPFARLEGSLATFHQNQVANSFSADLLIEAYGDFDGLMPGEPAHGRTRREDFKARLKSLRGTEGAGQVMVLFGDRPEDILKVHRLEPTGNDGLYQALAREAELKICRAHGVPPVLAGILTAGRLGASSEIREAASYFQTAVVAAMQTALAEALTVVLAHHRLVSGPVPPLTFIRYRVTDHIDPALYPDMTREERRALLLGLS
jgi:hypothetical protein